MSPGREHDQELIRQVVRGERPWRDLSTVGIVIDLKDGKCAVENPRGIVATADIHDLAKGLLQFRADVRALREWAYIVEAGSSFLDLDVEHHPHGEVLLDALWSASFGEPITEDTVHAAEELGRESESHV